MIKVALFPIPNCAVFPGTTFSLHVFEPRYREMVGHCLGTGMPMAITHTEAVISPAKPNQKPERAIHSNQATYKPYTIFSAGPIELIETLDDGRMMIDVHLTDRLYAINEIQTLPFSIYECESYGDRQPTNDELAESEQLKEKLLSRLIVMTSHNSEVSDLFQSEYWQQMDVVDFSFQLFGMVRLDGDIQQQILQCRSPAERLRIALQMLNRYKSGPTSH